MAHNIEKHDKVAFAGTGAWHGLGTVVPEDMDPAEAVKEYLGWGVKKAPLFAEITIIEGKGKKAKERKLMIPVDSHEATYRDDVNTILGVVGNKYQPIQHQSMVEDIKLLCGEAGAKVHTIGSLRGGKKVWILLKLTGTSILKDDFNQYIVVASSHDGSMSYTLTPTSVRVVCDNTFRAALGQAKECITIKHTRNAKDAIAAAREAIGQIKVSFTEFGDTLQRLAEIKVPGSFAEFCFNKLKPGEATQSQNVRDSLMQAYNRPRGGLTPAITNTALGVYNAVTEYVDWMARTRRTEGRTTDESRAESSLIGVGGKMRYAAFNYLSEVTKDKELLKVIKQAPETLDDSTKEALLALNS